MWVLGNKWQQGSSVAFVIGLQDFGGSGDRLDMDQTSGLNRNDKWQKT